MEKLVYGEKNHNIPEICNFNIPPGFHLRENCQKD